MYGEPGIGVVVGEHGGGDVEVALVLRVRTQVEVRSVGDAFEFLHAVGEAVHDIHGGLRVVRQFVVRDVEELQVVAVDPLPFPPAQAFVHPALVPILVVAGGDEELELHLLELAHPEDEVARRDLVAERLADLCDAERKLAGGGVQDVLEVREDGLRGLGPQIRERRAVVDRADAGLEHQVEGPGLGEVA